MPLSRLLRRAIVALILLVVIVAGALVLTTWRRLSQPYKAYESSEQYVLIPPGTPTPGIADRLVEAGVVRDRRTFLLANRFGANDRSLKAGEYRFDRPLSAWEVVDKLARGDVFLRPLTFREGLTIAEMAQVFADRGFGEAQAFADAARDASLVKALDPQAPDLEGYLFPDTYLLPRTTTADELVGLMVRRFQETFDQPLREAAAARGMSVREAVTLASLVEKETAVADERPIVSAVYHNRLKIGMGLQGDPTVIYALQREGRYDGNLTRADLGFDSPYNTYKYAGLPPGPIAAPGRASLEAAVRPADVDYLYFVSRNDGSHVFARTLDEHNRNVYEYQVKYFRERRGLVPPLPPPR